MRQFMELFAEKLIETSKHDSFFEKLQVFRKSMSFRAFSRNEPLFPTFSLKVHRNAKTWKFARKVAQFCPNRWFLVPFHEMRHFLHFLAQKFMKMPRHGSLLKKLQVLAKWMIFRAFSRNEALFAKSGSFREKARKLMDLVKTCNFSRKLPCFDVWMHFSAKSCKHCLISWKSTKTHRFGKNYAPFSNKLPCFGVSMNFSAKGCKKWLNSWESTKNHRFCQNFATFRTNYHVFAFPSTFQEKVAHFVQKHEKSSICPKLATLRWNYHVSAFWSFFQEKVAEKGSFREKARKIIDLAKTCNSSMKLPCFGVLVNFSAKSCKKWLISWKMTKNHRFGQKLQLFQPTTMFPRFGQLFSKKLQKVAHFVKNDEKSSIWPKVATFPANYHVSAFWSTFQQKGRKSGSFREKWRKIIDLA